MVWHARDSQTARQEEKTQQPGVHMALLEYFPLAPWQYQEPRKGTLAFQRGIKQRIFYQGKRHGDAS